MLFDKIWQTITQSLEHIIRWMFAFIFIILGVLKWTHLGRASADYMRWGYPIWFLNVSAGVEIIAGILLCFKKTNRMAAIVLLGYTSGALTSHIVSGETAHIFAPFVFVLFLVSLIFKHSIFSSNLLENHSNMIDSNE